MELLILIVIQYPVLTLFSNIIGLPERRKKRKSVLEITKMFYFKI